jgi:hypothetical protein
MSHQTPANDRSQVSILKRPGFAAAQRFASVPPVPATRRETMAFRDLEKYA